MHTISLSRNKIMREQLADKAKMKCPILILLSHFILAFLRPDQKAESCALLLFKSQSVRKSKSEKLYCSAYSLNHLTINEGPSNF